MMLRDRIQCFNKSFHGLCTPTITSFKNKPSYKIKSLVWGCTKDNALDLDKLGQLSGRLVGLCQEL